MNLDAVDTNHAMNQAVKNVVATLWSIADKQTAALSSELFRQLAAGRRPTEALRRAQLAMLNKKSQSHPFYWAAFTISGFSD